ncbi:hypothetical protein AAY473_023854, partial [Plecturocebus cupreus]
MKSDKTCDDKATADHKVDKFIDEFAKMITDESDARTTAASLSGASSAYTIAVVPVPQDGVPIDFRALVEPLSSCTEGISCQESWLGQRSTALICKKVASSAPLRRDSPKRLEELEGMVPNEQDMMVECQHRRLYPTVEEHGREKLVPSRDAGGEQLYFCIKVLRPKRMMLVTTWHEMLHIQINENGSTPHGSYQGLGLAPSEAMARALGPFQLRLEQLR